jgi:cobalamin biosynthesis Mg chelatase CobN
MPENKPSGAPMLAFLLAIFALIVVVGLVGGLWLRRRR